VAFIETADGCEVYFHCNSVLDDAFEHLTVGSEVRFVEEMGEKGPQATSVRDRASTASQQDFEINPRAHKLRITRKQRQRWQGCAPRPSIALIAIRSPAICTRRKFSTGRGSSCPAATSKYIARAANMRAGI
jgi:cold shock CspA family protein